MALLNQIMVSTFQNIYETENPTHLPLLEVLEGMMTPGDELKNRIKAVREAKTPAEQDRLKVMLLPVLCPSGTFSKRADSAILDYSGVICLDLDDTLDLKGMKALAKTFPYTLAAMVSPTKTGLKVFVLSDLKDPSRHSDLYHHLGDIMGFKKRFDLKFDPSCSNPSRACFFSYDPAMWINQNVIPFHVDLDTLPVYTPVPGTKTSTPSKTRTDIAIDTPDFPTPLTDQEAIREAIIDTHTLFEEYYPMHQGVRNNNLFILAFFFRLDGIPEDVASDYLVAYYVDPSGGFTADEIKRTVHSAYTR